jgi:hypothetical protein
MPGVAVHRICVIRWMAAIVVWIGLGVPALAGGVAEFSGSQPDSRIRVEFDGDRMRMEPLAQRGSGYVIARDGRLYGVSVNDGRPMVIDIGAMMQSMGPMMKQMAPQGFDDVGEFKGIRSLGRKETVAGIVGEVHELRFVTRDGVEERKEIVLGSDPRLLELSRAMLTMASAVQKSAGLNPTGGADEMARQLIGKNQGVLRFADEFRLLSLSGNAPAASRFELPAPPMAMPAIPGFMGGAAQGAVPPAPAAGQPPAAESGQPALRLPEWLGGKAQQQSDRVQGRAENEANSTVDNAVDKAVDRIFGRILGR